MSCEDHRLKLLTTHLESVKIHVSGAKLKLLTFLFAIYLDA